MRKEIGEPDYVRDSGGIWGNYTVTHWFYFDPGYEVFFHDRRLYSAHPMSEERRRDNLAMWHALQDVSTVIQVGASPRAVVGSIGEPAVVYVDTGLGYQTFGLFQGDSLDHEFPAFVTYTYPGRNIGVEFQKGSVAKVYPLGSSIQAQEQRTFDDLKSRQMRRLEPQLEGTSGGIP